MIPSLDHSPGFDIYRSIKLNAKTDTNLKGKTFLTKDFHANACNQNQVF